MSELKDRRALVLGGSRGIGAAIVQRLRADGAAVTFTFASAEKAAHALAEAVGAEARRADSSDPAAVAAVIAAVSPLDILVINAGVYVVGDPLTLDPATVDRMIDINIRGPYHAAVDAARAMNEGGRIVVIGSANADRAPFPGSAAYAMTKAAMQGMARGLARDFGHRGITVNVVQPGPVDTDMNPAGGDFAALMHAQMAVARHARPAELAGLVAYLVGPEAAMATGGCFTMDGGFSA